MIVKISPQAANLLQRLDRQADRVWRHALISSNELDSVELAALRITARLFLEATA